MVLYFCRSHKSHLLISLHMHTTWPKVCGHFVDNNVLPTLGKILFKCDNALKKCFFPVWCGRPLLAGTEP